MKKFLNILIYFLILNKKWNLILKQLEVVLNMAPLYLS